MKIVKTKNLLKTDRDVRGEGFRSVRILLERDQMGFSLHKTIINEGGPYHWHYKHHLESCYCVSGFGEIHNLTTGEVHQIEPDTTYVLDSHDNHTFTAHTNVVLMSVFNPPVTGNEVHDENGVYQLKNQNQ